MQQFNNAVSQVRSHTGMVEREVRFGKFVKGQFRPGVDSDVFLSLLSRLGLSNTRPSITQTRIYSEQRGPSYREIRNIETNEMTTQKKTNVKNLDIVDYGVRINVAIEEPIPRLPNNLGAPYTRNRTRYQKTVLMNNIKFTFHLTIIAPSDGNRYPIYEVEVEYPNYPLSEAEVSRLFNTVYNTVIPMKIRDIHNVIRHFNYIMNPDTVTTLNNTVKSISKNKKSSVSYEVVNETESSVEIEATALNLRPMRVTGATVEDAKRKVAMNILNILHSVPQIDFRHNKPIDTDISRYMTIKSGDFSCSQKADGVHSYLVLCEYGTFILSGQHMANKISRTASPKTLILEGEYITVSGQSFFLAFDLLYYEYLYLGESMAVRQNKLAEMVLKISVHLPVAVKRFYDNTDSSTLKRMFRGKLKDQYLIPPSKVISNKGVQTIDTPPQYESDGIIFTGNTAYSISRIYKWKPVNQLTIDFSVNNSGYLSVADKGGLTVFKGTKEHPIAPVRFAGLAVGQVGEILYDIKTGSFKLIRHRWDKNSPNYTTVAADVWNVLHNHVSKESLLGQDMILLRKYHNQVKNNMIQRNVKHGDIVLDIGGGRGGDLTKYLKAEANTVVFVEPDINNLRDLQQRLKSMRLKPHQTRFLYLNAYGQDTDKILEFLKTHNIHKVDLVAMFFSLTFFFNQKSDLTDLLRTIYSTLRKHGKFIGTVMDGNKTAKLLDNNGGIYNNGYFQVKYLKESESWTPRIQLNLPKDTIVGEQDENLVYFDKLQKLSQDKLHLVHYTGFVSSPLLSDSQNVVNGLYNQFVLCRSNTDILQPDELQQVKKGVYRVGVLGDGSCFIHSLLYCISQSYRDMPNKERAKFVKNYRKEIAERVDEYLNVRNYTTILDRDEFYNTIKSKDEWITSTQYEFFSYVHQINIVVLSHCMEVAQVNGKITVDTLDYPYSTTVVIYNIEDTHYEPIVVDYQDPPCTPQDTKSYNPQILTKDGKLSIFRRYDMFPRVLLKNGRI